MKDFMQKMCYVILAVSLVTVIWVIASGRYRVLAANEDVTDALYKDGGINEACRYVSYFVGNFGYADFGDASYLEVMKYSMPGLYCYYTQNAGSLDTSIAETFEADGMRITYYGISDPTYINLYDGMFDESPDLSSYILYDVPYIRRAEGGGLSADNPKFLMVRNDEIVCCYSRLCSHKEHFSYEITGINKTGDGKYIIEATYSHTKNGCLPAQCSIKAYTWVEESPDAYLGYYLKDFSFSCKDFIKHEADASDYSRMGLPDGKELKEITDLLTVMQEVGLIGEDDEETSVRELKEEKAYEKHLKKLEKKRRKKVALEAHRRQLAVKERYWEKRKEDPKAHLPPEVAIADTPVERTSPVDETPDKPKEELFSDGSSRMIEPWVIFMAAMLASVAATLGLSGKGVFQRLFILVRRKRLKGVILDKNGDYVKGVRVKLIKDDRVISTETDENGAYDLKDLTDDEYMLKISDEDGTKHLLAKLFTTGKFLNSSLVTVESSCWQIRIGFEMDRAILINAVI